MPQRLRKNGVPLCLVVGALDVMHTPQLARWADGRRYKFLKPAAEKGNEARGAQPSESKVIGWQEGDDEDDGAFVNVVYTPWMDHIALCHGIALLKLWEHPRIWMSSRQLQKSIAGPAGMRASL